MRNKIIPGSSKNGLKRFAAIAMTAVLAAGMLTGCSQKGEGAQGKTGGDGKTADANLSEYVYVAEYIPIEGFSSDDNEYLSFNNPIVRGHNILTSHQVYEENGDGVAELSYVEYDLETGKIVNEVSVLDKAAGAIDAAALIPEGSDAAKFATGITANSVSALPGDKYVGIITAYANEMSEDNPENNNYFTKDYLVIFDKDFNIISANEVDPKNIVNSDNTYLQGVYTDGKGNIAITASSYNEQGNQFGMASCSEDGVIGQVFPIQVNQISESINMPDGRLLALTYDSNWEQKFSEMNLTDGTFGAPIEGFSDINNVGCIGTIEGDNDHLLVSTDDTLKSFDLKAGTNEDIFNWSDVDIQGDNVMMVLGTEGGDYLVALNDWQSNSREFAKVSKKNRSEVAEKKNITIATFYDDYRIKNAAISFNKENPDYHVSVKQYYDWSNEDASEEDARNTMINDLLNGNNADIVNLADFSVTDLVKQNIVEDITPYIESSSVLDLSDYNESILNCYRKDGKIIAVPKTYELTSLVVNKDVFGDKKSWTVKEMIEFDKSHPNSAIADYSYRMSILELCLFNNMDYFVDSETGECRFDTDDFKAILEYAASYPEDYNWDTVDSGSSPVEKIGSGQILAEPAYLYDIESIQEYSDYLFNGKANFIGYPGINGESASLIEPSGAYAICSKSANKEDAWKFIEYVLTQPLGDNDYGFPANGKELKKIFDKELEKAGQKTGSAVGWGDGGTYEYHYATQEEIDLFYEILGKAKLSPRINGDQEIYNIIEEEIESYFSGQKSVDDVAKVIQSRVNLYVKENM